MGTNRYPVQKVREMGLFHCPLGVPYYDCDGCIDCGMCQATNKDQMIQASKVVRDYLKEQQIFAGHLKKIALCGKGGVGKSTILTLLADVFTDEGFSVLILDTDESNPGLSRLCGFSREPKPLNDLFLDQAAEGQQGPVAQWVEKEQLTIKDIPADYIAEKGQMKFLMVGKIEDPFQGCACSMADITRDLVSKLTISEKEILLIDTEAGVESFGRGVERSVDTVLSIVEPSFQSISLAVRIHYMAQGMGVSRVKTILNKSKEYGLMAGIHVVQPDVSEVKRRLEEGFSMIAYSLDITMIGTSCRNGLMEIKNIVK